MSVDSLFKKQEKDRERLSALDERELDLKSRLAGLKESLGGTLYKNEDASAWEVEIDGVQKDLLRCGAEKGKINIEMKKRIEEIRAAQQAELDERLTRLKSEISKSAVTAKKNAGIIESSIKDMAENIFQLTYNGGIVDSAPLTGLYDFPSWLSAYLWQEVNAIIAATIQGSRLPPQSNILPEPVKTPVPRGRREIEADLRDAKNRQNAILANLNTMRQTVEGAKGREKIEARERVDNEEKILSGVRAQVGALESELKTFSEGK
jgi:hypothetical protein